MDYVGISYGHLEYLTTILFIILLNFLSFKVLICCTKKEIWQPCLAVDLIAKHQGYQNGKNIPNQHKMYQTAIYDIYLLTVK
jgi:hypothetical protein